jgi:hypothetical protein
MLIIIWKIDINPNSADKIDIRNIKSVIMDTMIISMVLIYLFTVFHTPLPR